MADEHAAPDELTTAGARREQAANDPSIVEQEDQPTSRVGVRSPGDASDVGNTRGMTAETGGMAGTSR